MDVMAGILQCFDNVGISILPADGDVDLTEYITDSVQFMSVLIEVERYFSIEIPDDVFVLDSLNSLNGFVSMIENLIDGSSSFT